MIHFTESTELADYYRLVYRPCCLVGCSRSTEQSRATVIRHWQAWPGRVPIVRITSRVLSEFAAMLLVNRSPATVNTYLSLVQAILRHAEEEGYLTKAPRFRHLKEPRRVPMALTIDEFTAVLQQSKMETGLIGGIRSCLWWESFLCSDWESGLRVMALLSIHTADVLLEQSGFYCRAENQKDSEADWFPVSQPTANLIRAIYDGRRERLWPLDRNVAWLRSKFRAFMELAGIYAPKGACMAFHRIRKSTASYFVAAGLNAQKKLGHSSPKITARYLDPRIVRSDRSTELIPAPH